MIDDYVTVVNADSIRAEFSRLRSQLRLALVADRLVPLFGIFIGLGALSFVLDWGLDLSRSMRWFLLVLMGCGLVAYIRDGLWRVLTVPLSDRELAVVIEKQQPGLGEAAMVLLEFSEGPLTSARELAMRRRVAELRELDIYVVVDRPRARGRIAGTFLISALPLFALWIAPEEMGIWTRRWLPPSDVTWPTRTNFYLPDARGGVLYVPAGEAVAVEIAVAPGFELPDSINAEMKENGRRVWDGACDPAGEGRWFANLRAPGAEAVLLLEGGDTALAIDVVPVARPRVKSIRIVGEHPQYETPRVFSDDDDSLANLSFLTGTTVTLTATLVGDVDELIVGGAGGADLSAEAADDGSFLIAWTHNEARNLELSAADARSGIEGVVMPLAIGLQVDRVPEITVTISKASRIVTTTGPQVGRRITPNAIVPLVYQMRDDFAIASAAWELKHELPDGSAQMSLKPLMESFPPGTRDFQRTSNLRVEDLELPLDSRLIVTGVGEDLRHDGRQQGRASSMAFQIVAPDSLYRELMRRMQGQRARLRQLLERAEIRRDQMAKDEPLKDPSVASAWLREHQQDLHAVRTSREAIARVVAEMHWNQLGSEDVKTLVRRTVLDAADRLSGPLFLEQSDLLAKVLAGSSTRLDGAAGQEMIVVELKDLISAMNQWESFADVVRQLDEIINLEKGLRDKTEKLHKSDTDSLFDD